MWKIFFLSEHTFSQSPYSTYFSVQLFYTKTYGLFNVLYQTINLPGLSRPVNDISYCSVIFIVHSFFSSVATKFDHKAAQVLLSPWMEISPSLISYQKYLTGSRADRALLTLSSRQASWPFPRLWQPEGAVTFTQGFSRVGGCCTQSSRLSQPNLAIIIFTHSPGSDSPLGCCGSWRGSSLPQSPWRAIPYIFWPEWTVMRERKPLWCLLHHRSQGLSAWVEGWLRAECLLVLLSSSLWADLIWWGDQTLQQQDQELRESRGGWRDRRSCRQGKDSWERCGRRLERKRMEDSVWGRISSGAAGGGRASPASLPGTGLSSPPLHCGMGPQSSPSVPLPVPTPSEHSLLLLSLEVKQSTRQERLAPGWEWGRRAMQKDFLPLAIPV